MATKKFVLNNSYFKNCRGSDTLPQNPFECFKYFEEHGERPFNCSDNTTIYDIFIEYQKRSTYQMKDFDQFFTPTNTAQRLANLALSYYTDGFIIDACCGFGQITQFLYKDSRLCNYPSPLKAFDLDNALRLLCSKLVPNVSVSQDQFQNYQGGPSIKMIVSNPPYAKLPDFLERCYTTLVDDGVAVLLIPMGYIDKERPKKLVETLDKRTRLYREQATEEFVHTKIKTEIVILRK